MTYAKLIKMNLSDRTFVRSIYASEGWTPVSLERENIKDGEKT